MAERSSSQKMSTRELLIVIVIALGSFMAGLDATIVNIALPDIAKALDVSTVTVSWVLNAYLIILVSLLLAASRLGDMKGYRNIFLGGFAVFTIGSALCGLSPDINVLVLSRMIQAVGGAVISALGAVMVTSYLSASLRGQALGIVAMFTMLGAALGPVVGGFLTSAFSWQYIFFVNLPVGILAILLGMHILPNLDPVTPQAKIDFPGVALVFVALGTLIVGLTSIQGSSAVTGMAALVLSVIFWALFVAWERRAKEPLVKLDLLSNRAFTLQNVNVMLIQMAMAGVMVIMPFYLELVKRIATDNAGTILLALPVGMIMTAPISGKFSDVIGTKKPIISRVFDLRRGAHPPFDAVGKHKRGPCLHLSLPSRRRYRYRVLAAQQRSNGRIAGTGPGDVLRSCQDDDQPWLVARCRIRDACRDRGCRPETCRSLRPPAASHGPCGCL